MFLLLKAVGMFLIGKLIMKILAVAATVAITMTVILPMFETLQNLVLSKLNGMSADAVRFLQFSGIFEAVGIIFAAYALALSIKAAKATFQKNGSAD